MQIKILRDFKEDKRISMDQYADQIVLNLGKQSKEFSIKSLYPKFPAWLRMLPIPEIMKLRLARFLIYPAQASRLSDVDVYHIIDHGYAHLMRKIDPKKTVVTVHDLIPLLAYQKKIPGLEFKTRPYLVEYSLSFLKFAAKIITVSNNTKKDLVNLLGCSPEKIEVIHNGLGENFKPSSVIQKKQFRKEFSLPSADCLIILVTGTQVYKNHETSLRILKSLDTICDKPVYMLRLGAQSSVWDGLVLKYSLQGRAFSTGFIESSRIPDVYNCADCLLFPSWYEGFGWPPVEAMACGLPVIASNAASLPEVINGAGLLADPTDYEALTRHVIDVLKNKELRSSLIEAGFNRAKVFSWQKAAEKVEAIYRDVVRRKKALE